MAEIIPIGKLLDNPNEQRDAIHIAVAPVYAVEKMYPGQGIGLVDGSLDRATIRTETPIGIVDPFLKDPVYPDQQFFMWLNPYTITNLKHNWTHPAFEQDKKKESLKNNIAPVISTSEIGISSLSEKEQAELWLRDYAEDVGQDLHTIMYYADQHYNCGRGILVKWPDYLVEGDRYEGEYVPAEFWTNYGKFREVEVTQEDHHNFFSCAC